MNPAYGLLIFIIVILIGYVVYLQFEIADNRTIIEELRKTIRDVTASFVKKDTIETVENEIIDNNKLLDKETLKFIFDGESKVLLYMHFTREEEIAKTILSEGFLFENTLYKTTEQIRNDSTELAYKYYLRKHYGKNIIILGIAADLWKTYEAEIKKEGVKGILTEHLFVLKPPVPDEDKKLIYVLPSQFVKGFVNYETGIIVRNPSYNPYFNSPQFRKNLESYKTKV